MYYLYFWLDAVRFSDATYEVEEDEGPVKITLLLDKKAKSPLVIEVVDTSSHCELYTLHIII